jgi:hypothetical protein
MIYRLLMENVTNATDFFTNASMLSDDFNASDLVDDIPFAEADLSSIIRPVISIAMIAVFFLR